MRAELRVDWTQPAQTAWNGSVRLTAGKFESARPIQLQAGQVVLLPSADERELIFRSEGPTALGGLGLVVHAAAEAVLELELDGHKVTAPLQELLQGASYEMNSPVNARLRRDVTDILPVRVSKTPLIFAPGESVDFEVEFRLAMGSPMPATRFQVALRAARGGPWLFSREGELPTLDSTTHPRRTVTVRTPTGEGVYDLVIRAEPHGMHPAQRVVQFVVMDPNAVSVSAPLELETRVVHEIDPAQPASVERWYSTRRLRARTRRLGHALWTTVRYPFTSPDPAKESPLVSYRLNVENPGRPHLVSIEYENAGNLLLAAAISENDARGYWTQQPITSGIRTDDKTAVGSVQSHQIVCWPQTANPTITLSIDGPAGMGAVKRIVVNEVPAGLPRLEVAELESSRRFFGLYLDGPDVWGGWSSGRSIDSSPRIPIDDWRTYFDAMTHLAEYARFAGHNSMVVTVAGSGGTLYPSATLDAAPVLDTGRLADTGLDLVQKDVVELFLRICQRHHLSFIPSFRFDGAIVALERKLAGLDAEKSGLELVSRSGSAWAGPVRRYNPLHPQVQEAMLEVIREFAERYSAHGSFEGISLELVLNSHAVLPGLEWGYDDVTVEQFSQETGTALPKESPDDPDRFARRHQVLTTTGREAWLAWRCRKMSDFYEKVLLELQRVKPRGLLFVSLRTLIDPATDDHRAGRTIEEMLRSKGIDLRAWSAPSGIVVLRPFAASGSSPEGLKLNASREIDELMGRLPGRGGLCIHEPELLGLTPPRDGEGLVDRADPVAVPVTPPGRSNIRRYAQSLAAGDCQAIFEGGLLVPLGNEQVQREFARVFRSLPTSEFRPLETLQPVVVRSCRDSRDILIYLVNEASYAVETNLAFNCSAQSVLSDGASGDRLSTHPVDQGVGARLAMEPFQTLFLRLSGADSRLVQCDVLVPQVAETGLKVRFDRLKQAMDIMGSDATRTLDGLPPNGDFEEPADGGEPSNWSAEGDDVWLNLDSQIVHGGSRSLRLEGHAGSAAVSELFAPPEGRALAMNVWLRSSRPGSRIRWFLVGEHDGEVVYRCYADVTLGANWEPKQFRARDLPDGQIDRIQVKFQLLDRGSLWVDEARVCALPISQDEKMAISKSVSAIYKAWKERRWSDFERLSDGYWPTYLVETVEAAKGF